MSNAEQTYTQPLGLDVGTSRIVVARAEDKKYRYDSQLNAFLTLPYSKLAESLLEREGVFHQVQGSELLVAGNDAQRFAEVFHVETRRPMKNGVLNPEEPHSLAVVRSIVAKLIGQAAVAKQRVFFSVPAPGDNGEGGLAYHTASIRQMLVELGYEATPIEEGLTVVFGELGASNFSGIGVSCGSGLCNVCLAVLSLPVISYSIAKAGDYIDNQSALVTGDRATRLRVQKEQSFHLNGFSSDRALNALTVYYRDMMSSLADSLQTHIVASQKLPRIDQSIPLVLGGGSVLPHGFVEGFAEVMRTHELPLRISEIRVSADPLNSTARGALMAALC